MELNATVQGNIYESNPSDVVLRIPPSDAFRARVFPVRRIAYSPYFITPYKKTSVAAPRSVKMAFEIVGSVKNEEVWKRIFMIPLFASSGSGQRESKVLVKFSVENGLSAEVQSGP